MIPSLEGPPDSASSGVHVLIGALLRVRHQVAASLLAAVCLAIAAQSAVSFRQEKLVLQKEMRLRAEVLVRQLAAAGKAGILARDELETYAVVRGLHANAGVSYAVVLDNRGRVFAHSDPSRRGQVADSADAAALAAAGVAFRERLAGSELILEAVAPIMSRYRGKPLRVGSARIGLSENNLRDAIGQLRAQFAWITVCFILLALAVAFLLGRLLIHQCLVLAVGMKDASTGEIRQQIRFGTPDEAQRLVQVLDGMVADLREKGNMERYISRPALEHLREERLAPKLGGRRQHVTVLFSDVRGFTSLAESQPPEEVVNFLNIYLGLQADVIHRMGGTVDKFVGDEVMAVFTGEGAELNAARAVLEIQSQVRQLNSVRKKCGQLQIWVGMGLNCGDAIAGNMGSARQMSYTVIGDTINTAARLCGIAHRGQAVLTAAMKTALGDQCLTRALEPVALKGKKIPLELFELLDVLGPRRAHLRLPIELPASYKTPGIEVPGMPALMRNLGERGCAMRTTTPASVGTPLDIGLSLDSQAPPLVVSSVVRHIRKTGRFFHIGVSFERLDSDCSCRIADFVRGARAPQ